MVFGLPGNPVSTFVTFELFVRPALGRLLGLVKPELPRVEGELLNDMKQLPGRTAFLPARVFREGRSWMIEPLPWQGSGDIIGFSRGNAAVIFPKDRVSRLYIIPLITAYLYPDSNTTPRKSLLDGHIRTFIADKDFWTRVVLDNIIISQVLLVLGIVSDKVTLHIGIHDSATKPAIPFTWPFNLITAGRPPQRRPDR